MVEVQKKVIVVCMGQFTITVSKLPLLCVLIVKNKLTLKPFVEIAQSNIRKRNLYRTLGRKACGCYINAEIENLQFIILDSCTINIYKCQKTTNYLPPQ